MKGIDVSHWNQLTDLFKYDTDFIIAKITEGKTVRDYTCYLYNAIANNFNIPFGVYHYAHPQKNNVQEEIENLKNALRPFKNNPPQMIALDIEGSALTLSDAKLDVWCYEWLKIAEALSGAECLLYCSQSVCKRFQMVPQKFGLWVARYRKEEEGYGDVSPWNTARIWQYDSKDVDKNIMYTEGF